MKIFLIIFVVIAVVAIGINLKKERPSLNSRVLYKSDFSWYNYDADIESMLNKRFYPAHDYFLGPFANVERMVLVAQSERYPYQDTLYFNKRGKLLKYISGNTGNSVQYWYFRNTWPIRALHTKQEATYDTIFEYQAADDKVIQNAYLLAVNASGDTTLGDKVGAKAFNYSYANKLLNVYNIETGELCERFFWKRNLLAAREIYRNNNELVTYIYNQDSLGQLKSVDTEVAFTTKYTSLNFKKSTKYFIDGFLDSIVNHHNITYKPYYKGFEN